MGTQTSCIALFGEVFLDGRAEGAVPGGAPVLVARHLAAFGLAPLVVSRVGRDDAGDLLLRAMPAWGLATLGVQRDPFHPTGQVVKDREGHLVDIPPGQAWDHIEETEAARTLHALRPSILYFDTLAQRASLSCCTLWSLLPGSDALRFLDLNLSEPWCDPQVVEISLLAADVLLLNERELDVLCAELELPDEPAAAVKVLLEEFSIREVFLKRGVAGSRWFSADGDGLAADAAPVKIRDTAGVGEAFAAAALVGLQRGWTPRTVLTRANELVGAVCAIEGPAPDGVDFYVPFLERWDLRPRRHALV